MRVVTRIHWNLLLLTIGAAVLLLGLVLASPAVQSESGPRRLVVIGDIHGDAEQARAILQMAGVTDAQGKWIAQKMPTTVVQMGDLVDRGAHDRETVTLFEALRREAVAPNKVVVLLGNHEIMQLQGQFHYVHPESNDEFDGGAAGRKRELSPGHAYGDFMRSLPVAYVDMDTVFVHAGLMPEFARDGVDLLNQDARNAIETKDWRAPIFSTSGPVWTRTQVTHAMNDNCELVHESLQLLGLKRMVVGHTPQRSRLPGLFCNDTLLAVDVGISKWMYGGLAAVEFMLPAGATEPLIYEVLPGDAPNGEPTVETTASAPVPDRAAGAARDDADEARQKAEEQSELIKAMKQDPTLLQEVLDALQEDRQMEHHKRRHLDDDSSANEPAGKKPRVADEL